MKSVPCFIMFISLLACSGQSGKGMSDNPVGPEIQASGHNQQVVTQSSDRSDSLAVSFEGTKIRILNTSGGTRLVGGKHFIYDIDWNVHAEDPDGVEVDLIAISKNPEWHPFKGYVTSQLNMTIHCETWPDVWWAGPSIGYNSGFSDDFLVERPYRSFIGENGDVWSGRANGDGRVMSKCPVGNLSLRITDPGSTTYRRNEETGKFDIPVRRGGKWTLSHNIFPFPSGTTVSPSAGLHVTYHPIVPDSSYIESETNWLRFLLEDRITFQEQLEGMLPIWVNSYIVIGGPLVVPPDTTVAGHFVDEVFVRALEKLRAEYPNKVGFSNLFEGEDDTYLKIRTGIMSENMFEEYGHARIASRGRGYVGQPWSVFLYEKKIPFIYGDEILAHELGHNLNLIHTEEDPDYPGYPSELDKDGFLVESEYPHAIQRVDAFHSRPLMHNGFGNDGRKWLSEYNWNNILDFVNGDTLPLSGRVVAGGNHMWICNGDH
ncbi:MAG: hypothetical protein F4132_05465 [Gemmatimonadetes bacterium]|nr:hypothetical protein [Gemmatimonadota bacterium]